MSFQTKVKANVIFYEWQLGTSAVITQNMVPMEERVTKLKLHRLIVNKAKLIEMDYKEVTTLFITKVSIIEQV